MEYWLTTEPPEWAPPGTPSDRDCASAGLFDTPILIIEDESMIAWMIEDLLTDAGFTTIAVVASGAQALEQVRAQAPGLILSDINLGAGEDGIATVRSIREKSIVPAIFVSGYADDGMRERIHSEIGAVTVLRKPVDRTALIAAVMRSLGN
ncbi:MAG: response regulator [Sphingomicrobium sp.]